ESLTITPDQRYLYTAAEDALFQDGPRADLDNGSLVRIVKYDLQTREAVGEFVYELDEVAEVPEPADAFKVNGLVELLAVDNNGTLLALERSFSVGKGNTVRLYEIQTQGALDVSGENDLFREEALENDGEILEPGVFEIDPAVNKRLLVDFQADLGITPDNLEALALGPKLADGSQSLIVVSDNNFNDTQTTQFIALGLDLDTTPAVLPTVETPYTIDNEEVLEPKPLNILLVNDDGFEAEGIEVMYDALVAAGHNVTFVAPKEQQSGKGTLINVDSLFEPTEVVEFEENKWYVDGSPVVTTLAGLDFVLNGDNYLKFIVEELKPIIDKKYAVHTDRSHTFVMGSSMGGLMSMYAISEYPNIFGGAACISTHWVGAMPMDNNPFPEAIFSYMESNFPKAG
ncbi:MAG: esterase-like activity of phytase family protein, partial [Cyanobacteria bacterium J06649_11]